MFEMSESKLKEVDLSLFEKKKDSGQFVLVNQFEISLLKKTVYYICIAVELGFTSFSRDANLQRYFGNCQYGRGDRLHQPKKLFKCGTC